jgi:hypothetical protein
MQLAGNRIGRPRRAAPRTTSLRSPPEFENGYHDGEALRRPAVR